MVINNITISGFENLFALVKASFEDNRNGIIGSELKNYLNHCMVTIRLDEISGIELYYLKKMSHKITVLDTDYKNFTTPEENLEIYNHIQTLLNIQKNIMEDSDIDKTKNSIETIVPLGCQSNYVQVLYKGISLLSISGVMVHNFFKDEQGRLDELYPGNKILEKRIGDLFVKSYFEFIMSQMKDFDLPSSYSLQKNYYQYGDDICTCAEVLSPHGEIFFLNNTPERMNTQLSNIQKNLEAYSTIEPDDIYITYVVNTSFSSFMRWYLYTNYVVDHENFKLVFVDDNTVASDDILKKYKARLTNPIEGIYRYKKEFLQNQTHVDLKQYFYILGGSAVRYSVQIPLSATLENDTSLSALVSEDENRRVLDYMMKIRELIKSKF